MAVASVFESDYHSGPKKTFIVVKGGVAMIDPNKLYRDLQIHLDKQTVGFPATPTGSDIEMLKQLFTPAQAEIAVMLTYKYETLDRIKERAQKAGKSNQDTERILDETAKRGVIGFRIKGGVKQYCNIPYVIGMIEGAFFSATPETLPALGAASARYSEDGSFWRAFLNSKIPQMRTIPIQKSITATHRIGTYDEVRKLIEGTEGPIAILECACRSGAEKRGTPCKQTSRKETCMLFRDMARNVIDGGKIGRQISKEEALDILRQNQEDGLVLQPTNSQNPDAICSCCGCCCGPLRLHKAIPNPVSHWATNFFAEVNQESCSACGICGDRCQVGAMKLDDEKQATVVDLTRCLGCGLCVEACPEGAIELRNRASEIVPPRTMEDTTEIIMSNKS